MTITLWGVRGSIPCPGPSTVAYGGNTLCVELRFGPQNRLVVLDAGSGIRALGNKILAQDLPKGPLKFQVFFSHTHWDHILGFPFFTPIYLPGTVMDVFGPVTFEDDPLDRVIGGQLQYRYFPVTSAELAAKIRYHRLQEIALNLGDDIHLRTKYLNHPIACLGYRFEYKGKVLVTIFDHEPFRNLFVEDPAHPDYDEAVAEEGARAAAEENRKIEDFMRGADVVLHDAQYTQAEYDKNRRGWGHTPMETAIESAARAGVKKLVLLHHDPDRSDAQLDMLAVKMAPLIQAKAPLQVLWGREGMVL